MSRKAHPLREQAGSVAAVAAVVLLDRTARAASGKLLVFLHVALKQRAFQAELESALPELEVTAVGRPADFERGLTDAPDAVLTLPLVLASRGLKPALQGLSLGASTEKYSLVGADAAPNPATLDAVGALDVLGREGTTSFVHGLLGSKPKVERVTKVEDLLPLLQMQRVSAVLMPARLYPDFKAASRLSLVSHDLPTPVGLPAATALTPGGKDILARLGKLAPSHLKPLGIDGWR